jgi:hypothetical protein
MPIYETSLEIGAKRQGVYVDSDKMPSGDLMVTYHDDKGPHPFEVTGFQAWAGPLDKPSQGYLRAEVNRKSIGGASYVPNVDFGTEKP